MAIDQESFNKRLYQIFKTRGYKPSPKDSNNERTNPETADVFEFQFIKDGENYGKAWATIDKTSSLNIYYDNKQSESPPGQTHGIEYDDSWSGLLKHLKQWALSKQLNFGLHDSDRLGDDMRQRDYYKMKEKMNEGYHAVNQKTSYNDNIPNVKVVIQHDRAIQEGEQRWRNVHKIFVENTEGERFAVPTRMPGIARVYGRHVAEGGTPYDERGKHITTLVEEYTKMAGFVRATRRGEFNESTQKLIQEGVNHHKSLRESLQKMQSHRGYNHYFESWTPALMEDEMDSSNIAEMFAQGTIDPRIESVLPILNKLNSNIINEIEEVNELDDWAKTITEMEESKGCGCGCGSDCKCGPECKDCDCGKLDENVISDLAGDVVGKAIQSQSGTISKIAKDAGSAAASGAIDQVTKAIPGAVDTATDQAISNLKGPAIKTGAAIAGATGLAAYGGTKLANKQDSKENVSEENVIEGKMNRLVVDALEMDEIAFSKKHPSMAHRYDDIIAAFSEEDLKDKLNAPEQGDLDLTMQGDLDLNESYMRSYIMEAMSDAAVEAEVKRKIQRWTQDYPGNVSKIKAEAKEQVRSWKNLASKTKNSDDKQDYQKKAKVMTDYMKHDYSFMPTASSAVDSAEKEAQRIIDKKSPAGIDVDGGITIGRALAGLAGAMFENEKIDEFYRGDFTGDRNLPKKGKLVTKRDGREVALPLRTVDFRGDDIIVTGYKPPHKPSSTGRIYTDNGGSYFPSVANLEIIDHDFSDEIDIGEALTGNLAGTVAGSLLGSPGGIPGQLAGGIIGGITGDKLQDKIDGYGDDTNDEELQEIKKLANLIDKTDFSDKEIKMAYGILNDPRYKDGNLTGAIKAIEGIAKGLSEHPGVEKAIYMTQNEPDNLEENIRLGSKGYSVNIDRTGAESALTLTQFKSVWHDEFRDDLTYRDSVDDEMLELKYEQYLERVGIKPLQWPIDDELELEETISGGQTFAGDYKTGKAGQWRNTGKTKGRPARVGDLVGAESEGDDDYRHGDTVTINGVWHSLELDKDGQLWATDEDGGSKEFHKGSEDHKDPREEVLEDILRLSGLTKYEYAGTEVFSKYEG